MVREHRNECQEVIREWRGTRRLCSPLDIDDEGRTRKTSNTPCERLGDDRQDAPDRTTHQPTMTRLVI